MNGDEISASLFQRIKELEERCQEYELKLLLCQEKESHPLKREDSERTLTETNSMVINDISHQEKSKIMEANSNLVNAIADSPVSSSLDISSIDDAFSLIEKSSMYLKSILENQEKLTQSAIEEQKAQIQSIQQELQKTKESWQNAEILLDSSMKNEETLRVELSSLQQTLTCTQNDLTTLKQESDSFVVEKQQQNYKILTLETEIQQFKDASVSAETVAQEKINKLTAELRDLKVRFEDVNTKANEDNHVQSEAINELNEELEIAKDLCTQYEKQIERQSEINLKQQESLSESIEENTKLKTLLASLETEMNELKSEHSAQIGEIMHLKEELSNAQIAISNAINSKPEMVDQAEEASIDNPKLLELQSTLASELISKNELEEKFQTLIHSNTDLSSQIELLKEDIRSLEEQTIDKDAGLEEYKVTVANLEEAISKLESAKYDLSAKLDQAIADLETKYQSCVLEFEDAKSNCAKLENEIHVLCQEKVRLHEELSSYKERNSTLQNELKTLKDKIDSDAQIANEKYLSEQVKLEEFLEKIIILESKATDSLNKELELESIIANLKADMEAKQFLFAEVQAALTEKDGLLADSLEQIKALENSVEKWQKSADENSTSLEMLSQEKLTLEENVLELQFQLENSDQDSVHRIAELEKEIQAKNEFSMTLNSQINELTERIELLESEKTNFETSCKELAKQLTETNEMLTSLENENKQLTEEKGVHSKSLGMAVQEKESMERELNLLRDTADKVQKDNASQLLQLEHQIDSKTQSLLLLENEKQVLRNQLNEIRIEMECVKSDNEVVLTEMNQRVEAKNQAVAALEKEKNELETKVETLLVEQENSKQDESSKLTEMTEQLQSLKELLKSRTEDFNDAQSKLAAKTTELSEGLFERDTINAQLDAVLLELSKNKEDLDTLKSNISKLEIEKSSCESSNKELSTKIQLLQDELKDKVAAVNESVLQEKFNLEQIVTSEKRKLQESQDELKSAKETSKVLEEKVSALETEVQELKEKMEVEEEDFESKIESLTTEVQNLTELVTKLKETSVGQTKRMTEKESFLIKFKKESETLKETVAKLQSQIQSLKNELAQNTAKLEAAANKPSAPQGVTVDSVDDDDDVIEISCTPQPSKDKNMRDETPSSAGKRKKDDVSATFTPVQQTKKSRSHSVEKSSQAMVNSSQTQKKTPLGNRTGSIHNTPSKVDSPNTKKPAYVIGFSGFRDSSSDFNAELKVKLIKAIASLPNSSISASSSDEYDSSATHIIAPSSSRTLKTFAASLTSTWLITDPKWILNSAKCGYWLPEDKFGVRFEEKPFVGKNVFITEGFQKENTQKPFRLRYLKSLVEEIGKGKLIKDASKADMIVRGSSSFEFGSNLDNTKCLTWSHFVELIPQPQKK